MGFFHRIDGLNMRALCSHILIQEAWDMGLTGRMIRLLLDCFIIRVLC